MASTQSKMGPPSAPSTTSTTTKGRPRQRRATADSQIDRKRELDRIAQRMSRERSRNRIAFLEQKLESLEALDRGGQISSLMKVIEDLRQENTQLRASMMKIRFIADDLAEPTHNSSTQYIPSILQLPIEHGAEFSDPGNPKRHIEEDESQSTSSPQDQEIESMTMGTTSMTMEMIPETSIPPNQVIETQSRERYPHSANTMIIPDYSGHNKPNHFRGNMSPHFPGYDVNFMSELANFEATMASWQQPSFDWNWENSTQSRLPFAGDAEKWNISDDAFLHALELCRSTTHDDPILDPNVPVKAVLWGWHTVDPAQRNHPVWQALRQIDERVFGSWKSKAQKIAMMYVCQLMIQYRAAPTKENLELVPPFFRPCPSQDRIEHPLVIDFLIWPGLREHLVFEHQTYAPNPAFSQRFVEDLRFYWPYPDCEIFSFDSQRNTYNFSPRFKQSACDLKNWTMDVKFFETFREMSDNISASDDRIRLKT